MKETDDLETWASLESLAIRVRYDGNLRDLFQRCGIRFGSGEDVLDQLEELRPDHCNHLLVESSEHEERTGIRNDVFRDMPRLARVRWWAALRELRTECSLKQYRLSDAKSALQLAEVERFELIAFEIAEFAQQVSEEVNEVRKSIRAELRDHLAVSAPSVSTDTRKTISEDITDVLSHPPEIWEMILAPGALREYRAIFDRQHHIA